MARKFRGSAAYLIALLFIGSCTSATEPSPAALAGRYALRNAVPLANGFTILADTLILGADRSLARSQLLKGPGPLGVISSYDIGTYTVSDGAVVLRFVCVGGVCIAEGARILNAATKGVSGRVTQLTLDEDGRKTTFYRAQ